MKMPVNIAKVYLIHAYNNYCYPPPSFWPMFEHQLGNGDDYGFYWPVGRENEEPIILEMHHDTMEMIPQFSSLDKFLAGSSLLPDIEDFLEPSFDVDDKSPILLEYKGKDLIENGSYELAIECLSTALEVLPEYTEVLSMLAMLYRRLQDNESALEYAIRAFRCQRSFGRVNSALWPWFQKMDTAPAHIMKDPFWKHRTDLNWNFGDIENMHNYNVLQTIINEYLENKQYVEWYLTSLTVMEYKEFEDPKFKRAIKLDSGMERRKLVEKYMQLTGFNRDFPVSTISKYGEIIHVEK